MIRNSNVDKVMDVTLGCEECGEKPPSVLLWINSASVIGNSQEGIVR